MRVWEIKKDGAGNYQWRRERRGSASMQRLSYSSFGEFIFSFFSLILGYWRKHIHLYEPKKSFFWSPPKDKNNINPQFLSLLFIAPSLCYSLWTVQSLVHVPFFLYPPTLLPSLSLSNPSKKDDHSWLEWTELLSPISLLPSLPSFSLAHSFSLSHSLSLYTPTLWETYIDNPVTLIKWAPWRSLTLPHHHYHHHRRLAFFLYKQKSPRANCSFWINPANPITVTTTTITTNNNKQTNKTAHNNTQQTLTLHSSPSQSLSPLPTPFSLPHCASPILFFFSWPSRQLNVISAL